MINLLHYNRDSNSKLYILKSIKISNTDDQVLYRIKTKDEKQFDTTKEFIQLPAEKDISTIPISVDDCLKEFFQLNEAGLKQLASPKSLTKDKAEY